MNDSLRTDIFLRYSPEIIACACIYLSARELQISLPENPPWYVIFEADEASIKAICVRILHLYSHTTKTQEELEAIVNECRDKLEQEKRKAKETAALATATAVAAAITQSSAAMKAAEQKQEPTAAASAVAASVVVPVQPYRLVESSSSEKIRSFEKTKSISSSVLSATASNGSGKASSYITKGSKHLHSNTPPLAVSGSSQPSSSSHYYLGSNGQVPAASNSSMTRHLSFNYNFYNNHHHHHHYPPGSTSSHEMANGGGSHYPSNGREAPHYDQYGDANYFNENNNYYEMGGLKKNKSSSYLIHPAQYERDYE
jgi:hypothetical protein